MERPSLGLSELARKAVMSFICKWKSVAYHMKTSEDILSSDHHGRLAAMKMRNAKHKYRNFDTKQGNRSLLQS